MDRCRLPKPQYCWSKKKSFTIESSKGNLKCKNSQFIDCQTFLEKWPSLELFHIYWIHCGGFRTSNLDG